jgi:hypothetical protein
MDELEDFEEVDDPALLPFIICILGLAVLILTFLLGKFVDIGRGFQALLYVAAIFTILVSGSVFAERSRGNEP